MIRYQITDGTAHLDEATWLSRLNPSVDFIQIRESHLTIRDLARLVRLLSSTAKVLINDRTDVAIACGAAGVHLRSNSVSPSTIRRIAPQGFTITVACHSAREVLQASGADFALLAPIFRPMSKTDGRDPLGLAMLKRIATRTQIPMLALGGITKSNADLCVRAGAAGVAGITLFRRP